MVLEGIVKDWEREGRGWMLRAGCPSLRGEELRDGAQSDATEQQCVYLL